PMARAADATFVGVLALANEESVAKQLGLSDDTRTQLAKIIDQREKDALELAVDRSGSAGDQAAKLKQFREAAEQEGLKLLSDDQRKQLEQIRVGRAGLAALAEPEIAKKLQLTDDQTTKVADLLAQRDKNMAKATPQQKKNLVGYYERKFAEIITPEQKN